MGIEEQLRERLQMAGLEVIEEMCIRDRKDTLDDFPIKENEDVEDYFKRILGKSVEIRAIRIEPKQEEDQSNEN